MKLRVFVDTNILLSGIFFKGNEAEVLDLVEIELLTCEDVVDELRKVVKRKLKYLKERTFEIALSETERALSDITIIPRAKYSQKIKEADGADSTQKRCSYPCRSALCKTRLFFNGRFSFFHGKD